MKTLATKCDVKTKLIILLFFVSLEKRSLGSVPVVLVRVGLDGGPASKPGLRTAMISLKLRRY